MGVLVNTFSTEPILKITKNSKKKNEFLNIRVTFGRSPNVTNGVFLDSYSLKLTAESIAHSSFT